MFQLPDSWTYNSSTGVWTSSSGQTAYGKDASTGAMVGVGYKGGAVPVSIYAPIGGISPKNTVGAGSSGYIPKTGPGTTGMVESSPIRSSSDRFQPKPDRTPFTPAKDDKAVNVEGIGTLNKSEVVMAAKDYMSNSMFGMGYASLDPARRGTLETAYARSFLQKNIERDTADDTISKNEWLYGFVASGSNRLAGTAKAGGAMNAELQGKPTIEVINELSRVGNALVDEYKALDSQIKAYNPGYETTGAMAYPAWLNEKIVEYQAKVDAYNAMKNKYSSEINKYNATIADVSGAARASQIYKGGVVEKKSGFYTMGELPMDFQDISLKLYSDALDGRYEFESGDNSFGRSAATPIANIQEIIHGSGLDQFTQESIERGISIGTSNMYEMSNQSSNVPFPPYEPEPGESSIQNKQLLLRMEDVYPSLMRGESL